MSSKIVRWLVRALNAKKFGFQKDLDYWEKKSGINQEMVSTEFLPNPVTKSHGRNSVGLKKSLLEVFKDV